MKLVRRDSRLEDLAFWTYGDIIRRPYGYPCQNIFSVRAALTKPLAIRGNTTC